MFGLKIASLLVATAMVLGLGGAGSAVASHERVSALSAGEADFPACC